jgi:GDPmannose 4,6-dehydratase
MKSLKRNNSYVLLLTSDLLLHDIAKVAAEGAAAKVRTNLAEYLEKGIVK